jgi:capsular polysaccharide biosynthesis protein
MSEQALDLRRSAQIVRRYWIVVSAISVLGLAAGVGYAAVKPSMLASTALVRITSPSSAFSANAAPTLVVIASSDPVLSRALPSIQPSLSEQDLQNRLTVKGLTPGIISIKAEGATAAGAEETANAVARSFVAYIGSPESLSGSTRALVLQPASTAAGRPLAASIAVFGIIGLFVGAVLAVIGVLALSRRDRRLRLRDEIADSIGIPVLASIPVGHPVGAQGWVKLLAEYEPAAVDAWRLRGVLDHLGVSAASEGDGIVVAVVSLRSDPGALALGPQLATFAASLGIPTHLILGAQQDPDVTAALRAACAGLAQVPHLKVTVRDEDKAQGKATAALTVLIAVVDEGTPRMADRMQKSVALLGVSAGAATADQLARVAFSAAGHGRRLAGLLVADPDSTDKTTGRLPQLARTRAWEAPTHLNGIPTETRQWITQRQL